MSSRKAKLHRRGVATAKRLAAAYRCGSCHSVVGKPWTDAYGIQHVPVRHDDGCPVLTGALDETPDMFRAAARAGVAAAVLRIGGTA